MATIRDMLEANSVISRLADNPNLFVTTSFKLLPVLEFLSKVSETYLKDKEAIVGSEASPEEKEQKLNNYLDSETQLPEIGIGVNSLRNCGLTMRELQKLHWWLVEYEDEYED